MKTKLLIFFVLFLAQSIAWGYDIPLPENTTKQNGQKMNINGIAYNVDTYQSWLSSEEIASFFKTKLALSGFVLINENKIINTLVFSRLRLKENFSIQIGDRREGLTYFTVNSWEGDLSAQAANLALDKDSGGSDLAGVPRYPGSIRASSINSGRMKSVAYRTRETKEGIVSFYEAKMPSSGWKKFSQDLWVKQKAIESIGKGIAPDADFLIFEKNNFVCNMVIGPEVKCSEEPCPDKPAEYNIISIVIFSTVAD